MMIMIMRENRDIRPVLLRFGVAVVLSFAGFLFTRFRIRRIKPSQTFPSPPPSGGGDLADSEKKAGLKDDLLGLQIIPNSFDVESQNYEEASNPKATNGNPLVNCSPNIKLSGDDNMYLLPEFDELVKQFDTPPICIEFSSRNDVQSPSSDAETPKVYKSAGKDYEQEIRHLRNVVRILRERERCLEIQLLKFHGLREQENAVMELQNQLKVRNMEAKLFSIKIESLQTDNRRLEAQVANHAKVLVELEAARAKVKSLKKKLRYDAEQNKEQILILQQRVAKLQDQEEHKVSDDNPDVQLQLQRLKALEIEMEELRESNMRLQLEKSELAQNLEPTRTLAASVLEDPEAEELKEESHHLKEENEGLAKEVERLQVDSCADVEELVYLRWLNACLRYELRNYQPQPGKTVARDLSKSLSPTSEEKAKQLILEYANTEGLGDREAIVPDFDSDQWSSSQEASYLTDSGENDETSGEKSSATRTNTSSKMNFFSKLRRLVQGKGSRHHRNQASSVDKNSSSEEMRVTSPRYSSGVSTATDAQSNRVTSPPHGLSRLSLDIQRPSNLNLEDIKDLKSNRRKSDVGSLRAYKRFVLGEDGDLRSLQEKQPNQDLHFQKSELVKYADALKDTRCSTRKLSRKPASFSSY